MFPCPDPSQAKHQVPMILSCNESVTKSHHTALGPIQTLRLRHQFIGLHTLSLILSHLTFTKTPGGSLPDFYTPQCVIPDGKPTLSCAIVSRRAHWHTTLRSVKSIYLYCGHTVDLVSRGPLKFGCVI